MNARNGLIAYPPRLTQKHQQQLISNWLPPQDVRELATITEFCIKGSSLHQHVFDGRIIFNDAVYHITWLDFPETCYSSELLGMSFRGLPAGYPSYVLIKPVAESYARWYKE